MEEGRTEFVECNQQTWVWSGLRCKVEKQHVIYQLLCAFLTEISNMTWEWGKAQLEKEITVTWDSFVERKTPENT